MDQTSLVQYVLELTRSIEQAARLADWEEATRLVDVRMPYLMSITAEQTPATLELVRQIQALDAAVFSSARTTQTELQAEYRAAMDRASAASAYQQAAARF
jgi:flagellar protein FliT